MAHRSSPFRHRDHLAIRSGLGLDHGCSLNSRSKIRFLTMNMRLSDDTVVRISPSMVGCYRGATSRMVRQAPQDAPSGMRMTGRYPASRGVRRASFTNWRCGIMHEEGPGKRQVPGLKGENRLWLKECPKTPGDRGNL